MTTCTGIAATCPVHKPKHRACFYCAKVLMAAGGFIETVSQPDGERRDFCSKECEREQLTEDLRL